VGEGAGVGVGLRLGVEGEGEGEGESKGEGEGKGTRFGRRARGGRVLGAGGGRAARTGPVASRLAPLAMRRSRQSSLPLRAAYMRAVLPACGGAATAAHAISAGGKRASGGSTGMADGEGGVCGRG